MASCSLDEALKIHDALAQLKFPCCSGLLEELAKQFERFELSQLSRVTCLSLTKNIQVKLSSFTSLTSLRISHPDIEEDESFSSARLQHLSLTLSSKVNDITITRISSNLRSLMLGCTKISNAGLKNLPIYLTALNVGGCNVITDEGLSHAPLTLTDLNVSNTLVTIDAITRLSNLRRINIVDCSIHGTALCRLSVVELTISKLKEEELAYLPRCLRKLNILASLLESLAGLPQLLDLRIRSATLIDDSLLYLYRGLTVLDLSLHIFITAEGIKLIPRTVRVLLLWRCSKIDDAAIKVMPRKLLHLDVSGCKLITNEGIKDLPRSLTELDIDGCSEITDAAIPHFPVNLSKIHYARTQITHDFIHSKGKS